MSYYNKDMTREQAWDKLYMLANHKSKEEMKEVFEEYKSMLPEIVSKELSGPPMLTSYQV